MIIIYWRYNEYDDGVDDAIFNWTCRPQKRERLKDCYLVISLCIKVNIDPFVPNVPFFCFQRVEKGSNGNKWVKY